MRLANKLAIVTAGASGMGRAGVELFLREGAKVAAIDVNAEALAALKVDAGRRVMRSRRSRPIFRDRSR
jgi:NAD(P)-dependent dehydrogenase (short-subunit alcohol dehydrogenase family)